MPSSEIDAGDDILDARLYLVIRSTCSSLDCARATSAALGATDTGKGGWNDGGG